MPWGRVPTVWGTFHAEWEAHGILALRFPPDPPGTPRAEDPILTTLAAELDEYLRGERTIFHVPLRVECPPFFRAVWEEVLRIPYGEVRTYGELAERMGNRGAARAVGQALAGNPLPILIPCHRVVAARGLGGYGPGVAWKEKLLALEARHKEKFSPR